MLSTVLERDMSSNVKYLAFSLFPCFILVACAPPEHVNPLPKNLAEAAPLNATGNHQPPADHAVVSPGKIPAPSGKNEPINKTETSVHKTGSDHPSVTNITGSAQPTPKATAKPAPPGSDSAPNATTPSHAVNNGTIPTNGTSPNVTAVPPHHKKLHTTVPPHSTPAHPRMSVPFDPLPEPENTLEDVAHPAPRPLRAAEKFNPTFGAIVAAICITTAVGGYVILMAWRKIEIDRYGNRQMLINEDDFGDIQDEDMRHFEASCIQIDA